MQHGLSLRLIPAADAGAAGLESGRVVPTAEQIAVRPAHHDEDLIFARADGTPITKTIKYVPTFPGHFANIKQARDY